MNTELLSIEIPELSDETVSELGNFLYVLAEAFSSQYDAQITRHNRLLRKERQWWEDEEQNKAKKEHTTHFRFVDDDIPSF